MSEGGSFACRGSPRYFARMSGARGFTVAAGILAASLPAGALAGQEGAGPPADRHAEAPPDTNPEDDLNPFAGFDTHYLANGVKVWFKRLGGAPNVTVSAGVPVGSDADPPGKEHLAHLLEHLLFSDHGGRTEQEIKDAVEGLGGTRNGLTYSDHTWYYVRIAREHGLFAIEWLADILSPHTMEPDVVERGREPVQNEIAARPRELFDHLRAAFNPAWMIRPSFWEREYGMRRLRDPFPDEWESVERITPEDLRDFYDRYYAPGAMTVTIVGDLDRDQALAVAARTFGKIPARPVQRWEMAVTDPGRAWARYEWMFQARVDYRSRHKLFNPTSDELLATLFIRDLLNRRLNQRLRFGERKAAYSVSANLAMRGAGAYLELGSAIDRDDYAFATEVIDEEIEFLRNGSLDPAVFETDRAALVERLRASNRTALSLNAWTVSYFHDPEVFTDFPDLLSFYEEVSQSTVASFAGRLFDPSRRVLTVTRPQPVRQELMVAVLLLLVWLTLRVLARVLTKPIRMRGILYIGRFRLPVVLRATYALGIAAAVVVLARLAGAGYDRLVSSWMESIDHYTVQAAGGAVMVVVLLVASSLIVASSPRRILLFADHLRIKSRAWRSRILKPEDIAEISVRRFGEVWLSRDVFRSPPLAFGLIRLGIHVRPHTGRSYFFRSRDTKELAEVLMDWWEGEREPPDVK